jgi:hypothetical protein
MRARSLARKQKKQNDEERKASEQARTDLFFPQQSEQGNERNQSRHWVFVKERKK